MDQPFEQAIRRCIPIGALSSPLYILAELQRVESTLNTCLAVRNLPSPLLFLAFAALTLTPQLLAATRPQVVDRIAWVPVGKLMVPKFVRVPPLLNRLVHLFVRINSWINWVRFQNLVSEVQVLIETVLIFGVELMSTSCAAIWIAGEVTVSAMRPFLQERRLD